MPFKNVHYLWKKVKTFTRGHAHFSKAFMVFELNHIVFELELLIPIKYLVAPNILKLTEGI